MNYPILQLGARVALDAFAEKYAKVEGGWKEHLCILWATGGDTQEPHGDVLRGIRNAYGPTWLIETYSALWQPDLPAYEVARWSEDHRELLPTETPDAVRWSGRTIPGSLTPTPYVLPPAIGDTVFANTNKIGDVVVTGYFVEQGWLGFIGRAADGTLYHLFGVDLKIPEPA